ncbi:hypothetical protein [Nocardia sp. NPDC020380]|uniref:hypothetical protein n=1 Tax=Nocardia sp. NPDC020380 TaxID=3364309 RepID=UPI0037B1BA99
MNLRSLLHRKARAVPLLPAAQSGETPPPTGHIRKYRRKANGALEEKLERLLTPSELDLVQHHRI